MVKVLPAKAEIAVSFFSMATFHLEAKRNITRPENTVGVECKTCYEVRSIIPVSKRVNKNTKCSEVVEYIESCKFVPKQKKPGIYPPYMVSAGAIVLILSMALPMFSILTNIFPLQVAQQIFVLACLKNSSSWTY